MEVFRLSRRKFSNSLSGKGAALRGARWNSMGVEMIYTAANRSLAMAEVAVHLTLATLPDDFEMITLDIPEIVKVKSLNLNDLPPNWNTFPHQNSTQKLGDQFIYEGSFCVLKVPSAVTKGDYNFLINPHHTDFAQVSIINTEPFPFDRRIFKL